MKLFTIKNKNMETQNKKQELPKWFDGQVYTHGESVTNPFSSEVFHLNNIELSMYDFIMGAQYLFERSPALATKGTIDKFHKGLDWFRKNNVEAYFALLD
jgi:hypothetical protein